MTMFSHNEWLVYGVAFLLFVLIWLIVYFSMLLIETLILRFREYLNHRKHIQYKREMQKDNFRLQRIIKNKEYNKVCGIALFNEYQKEMEEI